MTSNSPTWTIADTNGGNARSVTLAQFRAELDAARALAAPISAAWRKGDLAAVSDAQSAMRTARA